MDLPADLSPPVQPSGVKPRVVAISARLLCTKPGCKGILKYKSLTNYGREFAEVLMEVMHGCGDICTRELSSPHHLGGEREAIEG